MNFLQRTARRFGFELLRSERAASLFSAANENRGWLTVWSGGLDPMHASQAFQLDLHYMRGRAQENWAVWACQTLIAGDIGKLRMTLVEQRDGVWQETSSRTYDRLLRKPNDYQTRQQFFESWSLSKQRRGNAYILLERDGSTRVRAMHVLDPDGTTPMVAPVNTVAISR